MKKSTIYISIFTFLFTALNIYAEQTTLPEPYKSIAVLPFDNHGWFRPINQKMLQHFLEVKQPQIIVEIGSWLGSSARFMASLLPENGKLYAIDHWGACTELASTGVNRDQYTKNKVKTLYQQFLSNVIHANLTHKIIPLRMASLEAARGLNISADLIYIDGSHEENDVYNDIMAWFPKLTKNGILCGDDFGGGGPYFPVKKAVERAAKILNVNVNVENNWFWYFTSK